MITCPKCKGECAFSTEEITGYITHEMAMDAEDLTYEGMLYQEEEPIWGVCPCCGGYDYDNCSNCSKVLK